LKTIQLQSPEVIFRIQIGQYFPLFVDSIIHSFISVSNLFHIIFPKVIKSSYTKRSPTLNRARNKLYRPTRILFISPFIYIFIIYLTIIFSLIHLLVHSCMSPVYYIQTVQYWEGIYAKIN